MNSPNLNSQDGIKYSPRDDVPSDSAKNAPKFLQMALCNRVRPTVIAATGLTVGTACTALATLMLLGSVAGPVGAAIGLIVGAITIGVLGVVLALRKPSCDDGQNAFTSPLRANLSHRIEADPIHQQLIRTYRVTSVNLLRDTINECRHDSSSMLMQARIRVCMDSIFGRESMVPKEEQRRAIDFLENYDDSSERQTETEREIGNYFNTYLDENLPHPATNTELPISPEASQGVIADFSLSNLDHLPGKLRELEVAEVQQPPLIPHQLERIIIQATECSSGTVTVSSKKVGVVTLLNRVFGSDSQFSQEHQDLAKSCLDTFVRGNPNGGKEIQNYFAASGESTV